MHNIQKIINSIPASAYNRNYKLINLITRAEITNTNLNAQLKKVEQYLHIDFESIVGQMQEYVKTIKFGITPKCFCPISVYGVIFYNTQQFAGIAAHVLGGKVTKFYINKLIQNRLVTDSTNCFYVQIDMPYHIISDYYRASERTTKITHPISCLGQVFPSARAAAQTVAPTELTDASKYRWVLEQIKLDPTNYFYLPKPKPKRSTATRPYVEIDGVVYKSVRAAAQIVHRQFGLTEASCTHYITKQLKEENPRFRFISREELTPELD